MYLDYETAKVGDRIAVSDSTKRPPDRFHKKLARWKDRNFTGTILKLEAPSNWNPFGGFNCENDEYPAGKHAAISFTFSFGFGPPLLIEKLEEEEALAA